MKNFRGLELQELGRLNLWAHNRVLFTKMLLIIK
nr:MAG TPA: hypothetical protein [Caudoviricetes sp.]